MIIEITHKFGNRIFPNIGEFYFAKPYRYDSDKVTLFYQTDNNGVILEKQHTDCGLNNPLCNEYRDCIKIIKQ